MTSKSFSKNEINNENIELADEARRLFCEREFKECIQTLDKINNPKSTQANKLIAKFLIDKNAKIYFDDLEKYETLYLNQLNFNQQTVIDYNKAIVLSKYLFNFEKAIGILQSRIKLIENKEDQLNDLSTLSKVYILLVTILLERKFKIKYSLQILDNLYDKLNGQNLPKNFYYLKVRCYLACNDVMNYKKYMDKLNNNQEFMVKCFLQSFEGYEQSVSKLQTFNSLNKINLKNNEALAKFSVDKVSALYDLSKIYSSLTSEVLYNFALMHFHTGNVENALNILKVLIKEFRYNPKIWSRIGDCYLILYKFSQQKNQVTGSDIKIAEEILPRKLILKNTEIKCPLDDKNLKNMKICYLNCLVLMNNSDPCFYPSNEMNDAQSKELKISVLVKLIYTNLCLCDFVNANLYADICLNLNPYGIYFVQSMLYKCESLLWQNCLDQAEKLIKKLFNYCKPEKEYGFSKYIKQSKKLKYIDYDKNYIWFLIFQNLLAFSAMKMNGQDFKKFLNNVCYQCELLGQKKFPVNDSLMQYSQVKLE